MKQNKSIKKNKIEKDPLMYGTYDNVRAHIGNIRYQKLYNQHNLWIRYLFAVIMGVVMAFVILFLLKNTGLYNSGLSGFLQGISRFIYVLIYKNVGQKQADASFNILFWGIYLLFNIPLLIFSWFKVGKTFTKITLVFLVVNTLVGIGISFIHDIDKVFLFGNTKPHGTDQGDTNVFSQYGVYNIPFYFEGGDQYFNIQYDSSKSLMLLIYGLAYGLFSAACYSVLYIIGGCSGGMDYISIYYATKKQKPLGATLVLINSISLILGVIIGSYISGGYADSTGWNWEFLLSSNLVSSFIGVLFFGFLLSYFYPINKWVKVEIHGKNNEMIRDYLFNSNYKHSLTFIKTEGGYSRQESKMLVTICSYIELPRIINKIRQVDHDAFITVSYIRGVDGNMSVYRQGSI